MRIFYNFANTFSRPLTYLHIHVVLVPHSNSLSLSFLSTAEMHNLRQRQIFGHIRTQFTVLRLKADYGFEQCPGASLYFFLLYVQHICTYSRQRLWWWVWHQEFAAPNPPSRNSANNCANYCTSQRLDVTYAWVAVAVVFEAPPQLSLSNPKAGTTPHFHSPITHAHTHTRGPIRVHATLH